MSTFSVTTKRLLRCLRGGLPTIGIVSRGPERRRFRVLARGGVELASKPIVLRSGELYGPERGARSDVGSELTTTIGGMGVGFPVEGYLRSDGEGTAEVEEAGRAEDDCPCEVRE
jgi:hypothetical protein